MASINVGSLGDYIRDQRRAAEYSLRQLADAAGVSNPYLSQIERGVRKPSAEILQQIAKALRISAETLYVRAGILDERETDPQVEAAILGDAVLTDRQKRVLLDIYESFYRENARPDGAAGDGADPAGDSAQGAPAAVPTAKDLADQAAGPPAGVGEQVGSPG